MPMLHVTGHQVSATSPTGEVRIRLVIHNFGQGAALKIRYCVNDEEVNAEEDFYVANGSGDNHIVCTFGNNDHEKKLKIRYEDIYRRKFETNTYLIRSNHSVAVDITRTDFKPKCK